ncbi:hypothetical protein JW711_06485 [Candidatus Woesearchaeota archaeon]|nr:hypothetical protein [Candidatus Woesearchaeota archaeon]
MKVQDLKIEDLEQILKMWQEAGGCAPSFISASTIYDEFQRLKPEDDMQREILSDGFRIGSKWTGHSKLRFEINDDYTFTVRFNTNLDPSYEKGEKQALAAARKFEKRVSDYLASRL